MASYETQGLAVRRDSSTRQPIGHPVGCIRLADNPGIVGSGEWHVPRTGGW